MRLLKLDTPGLLQLAANWLARKENCRWLDFGGGRQPVTAGVLRIMTQRDTHFLRAYTGPSEEVPIGIIGLNSVDRVFGTGTFWGVTGEKAFTNRGYATEASGLFLALAFRELGLRAINTWVVDGNPSRKIVERLGFRYIGRQRTCHWIDGVVHDRHLYDLLAHELVAAEGPRRLRVVETTRGETAA